VVPSYCPLSGPMPLPSVYAASPQAPGQIVLAAFGTINRPFGLFVDN
jgi:hypothetical protein